MNDDELTRKLRDAAARVSARPDLGEVELGAGRLRSRRRVATGVVAAMLVAGAGGAGFGIGSAARGDQVGTADAAPETVPLTVPAATEPSAPAADTVAPPAPNSTGTFEAGTEGGNDVANASRAPDFDWQAEMYPGYPLTLVSERTLDSGYRVRVLRGEPFTSPDDGAYVNGWQPASFCWGGGELRVTIDGPDLVEVTGSTVYTELFRDVMVTGVMDAGHADGRPLRIATLQSNGDAAEATITWDDGATDSAQFVDGLVALVTDGAGAASWESTYTLTVRGPSGEQTFTQSDFDYYSDPEYRAACEPPPPTLPEPGEQPADPDAERAAIEERFQLLWDRSIPAEEKPAGLLDDDTGIADATAVVFDGGFAEAAESAVHTIEELVFTGPAHAWFRYGIDTSNGFFGDRYGVATLTDAGWTFPRAIVCQDLALAGGTCDPPAETIYPPSWYEINGQQCIYDPNTGADLGCITYEESEMAAWP